MQSTGILFSFLIHTDEKGATENLEIVTKGA